jgi:pimeloyl-ACP methyl ester carboxylesterase
MKYRIGDALLQVSECGSGPQALVFLHYFGSSGQAWAQVAALLADHWRCVMPDLRGFGASDAVPDSYNVNDAADEVLTLVHAMGIERFGLVGHSMGGKIAMTVAARQPPGLTHLVLLAPSPPTPEPMEPSDRAKMLASQTSREAARETASKGNGQPLPAALVQQVVDDQLRTSPAAWQWWLTSGSCESVEGGMTQITVPVQVLSGTLDTTIPTAVIEREVMARLPQSHLHRLADCGHLLPLEAPQAVAQVIWDMKF